MDILVGCAPFAFEEDFLAALIFVGQMGRGGDEKCQKRFFKGGEGRVPEKGWCHQFLRGLGDEKKQE